ncbi:MAG: hypothetical protein ACMUIP_10455 [bacterium]
MQQNEVKDLVINTIKVYLKDMYDDITTDVDSNTILLGEEGLLDSLGLINILVDIETRLKEKYNDLSLTTELIVSIEKSPYRMISTFTDYILDQINKINLVNG